MLVAILLALWFTRRLTRPLRGLLDLTEEIAAGRLEGRPSPRGVRELEVLGDAMNRMAAQLAASRERLAAWRSEQVDDLTVLVIRYDGPAATDATGEGGGGEPRRSAQ